MKAGSVVEWLDQGPAILLEKVDIPAPCLEEELGDYLADPDSWPSDVGWKIQLIDTGEILDVHEETLHGQFPLKVEGVF